MSGAVQAPAPLYPISPPATVPEAFRGYGAPIRVVGREDAPAGGSRQPTRNGPSRPVTGKTVTTATASEVNDFYAPWVREMMERGRREVIRDDDGGKVSVSIGGVPGRGR
jgi:hypothetical protein